MLLVYILSRGTPEENLEQIFKLLNENNSGEISAKEFKQVVHDMFLLANVEDISTSVQELLVEKAFIEMDKNDDGKITLE
jgi:Ca2+-binding EF-hand superfamily protein